MRVPVYSFKQQLERLKTSVPHLFHRGPELGAAKQLTRNIFALSDIRVPVLRVARL